ncbi:hypothetical protein [Salinigranum marinum]|nr:hypothetical protein [Salinigranum marinum]
MGTTGLPSRVALSLALLGRSLIPRAMTSRHGSREAAHHRTDE